MFTASIPGYFAALHMPLAPNTTTFTGQLSPDNLHTLQALGLSVDFYAACMVTISLLFQFSFAAVGILLFWRKSDDRVALLASFALMLSPFGFAYLTLQTLPPGLSWLIPTLSSTGNASLMFCAYVFPDGRFVPRWTRWLALVMIGYWATMAIFPSWILSRPLLELGFIFGLAMSVMIVQVYRYQYVSTAQQRLQTRWVVFGISIAVAGNIGARLLSYFVLPPFPLVSAFPGDLEVVLITVSMLAIPPTLAIAILHSRLWDIDVIIKRTLVYGALTGVLALVYFGSVVLLQFLLRELTGQLKNSPIAIVGSTLVIAALFQPLRKRIQRVIDRRFYRRKYDAAQTLEAFSATLYNELDLEQLSEQLVTVVEETMQPAHVSLWLRSSEQSKERSNPKL